MLARHVQLKIMPVPLFKTKCYQILVSKPLEGNRREAESTHLPRFWHSPASLSWQIWQTVTVVPRFNEVPRDWRNLFAILRVRYIEHLHLSNFRAENYQNNRYIEVKLIVYLQNPAFLDLKNYWLISFHYRAIHSYGTKNSRTGKQNCLKLSTHKFHPCWSVWHSSLITDHMLTFIRYIEEPFYVCACVLCSS